MVLEQVTIPILLSTAIVDSINPCAIGVLLLLLGVLIKHSKEKRKLVKIASIYIAAVYLVYMLAGLGLIWFQSFLIKLGFATYLGAAVGGLVIIMGIIEIKDFFWYGKGFSLAIPAKYSEKIKVMTSHVTVASAIILGAFVATVELPCTGGPYLAITALLAKAFNLKAFIYLLIYNVIFVLPLIIISVLAYYGTHIAAIKQWKTENKKWMRLAAGIVMIALGAFLMWYYITGAHL